MARIMNTEYPAEPQWTAAAEAISRAHSVLVVAHIAPDGDAVGSLLGLALPLRRLGKDVIVAIDDGPPCSLRFIPGSDTILSIAPQREYDLLIAVDSSDIERIGQAGAKGLAQSKLTINLDHHPTNTRYADINLVVPHAVAAVEIVYDLLQRMAIEISADVACALLTGLVTDTQGFRISATSSRTLEIAQDLMNRGAPLAQIMANTLNSRSLAEVELWKLVLPTVRLDRGLIHATIRQSDIRSVGMKQMSDGGLVSHLVNVKQARVSIVFKELPDQEVEVAFRSKPGFDVASLALQLGGGGHTLASGCTAKGTLEQVQETVLPLARKAIAEGTSA